MRFEHSGLSNALYRMRKNMEKESRKLARKQGNLFVRIAKKISFQHAPDPIEILDLMQKYGSRLRRARGVTVPQEIGRRISKIGLLARNWRFWKVEESLGRVRVWIKDNVSYSKVVDDKQGLLKEAAGITQRTLKKGMGKTVKKVTGDFNRGN